MMRKTSHGSPRLDELDAARGTAMLFVFLAHFSWTLRATRPGLSEIFISVGMVATPFFLLLSGMMLGMFWRMRPLGFHRTQESLLNRSVILLLAHFLIALIVLPQYHQRFSSIGRFTFITDAIAFAIVAGPLVLRVAPMRTVPLIAFGMYALSWLVLIETRSSDFALKPVVDVLDGFIEGSPHYMYFVSPLLPYFAIYLAGSWIGARWIADGSDRPDLRVAARKLFLAGALALLFAVVLVAVRRGMIASGPSELSAQLLSRYQKVPPGPFYLALYGGVALVACAGLCMYANALRRAGILGRLAVLGRASLALFIMQFFVYFGLSMISSHLPPQVWPLVLLGSIAFLWLFAYGWDRIEGNRYLTVGIRLPAPSGQVAGP